MTDQASNTDLIDAHRERLRILEVSAAKYGNDAPPHIVAEINKIVATLRALNVLHDLTPDHLVDPNETHKQLERRRDTNTNEQATLRMIATVQSTVAEVGNVKADMRQRIADVKSDLLEVRNEVRADIQAVHDTINHFIRNFILAAGITAVIFVLFMIVLGVWIK